MDGFRFTLIALMLLVGTCAAAAEAWKYRNDQDAMTSKPISTAALQSSNSLSLRFPYAGPNYGSLVVRKHPQHGVDVALHVQRGQLLCPSYDDCTVQIRFGDAPPIRIRGVGPSDHSTQTVFLRDPSRFIAKATRANRILIEAEFFQNGRQVLEFNSVAPLKWEVPAPAAAIKRRAAPEPVGRCPPSTSIASTGECGRLYAECHVASRSLAHTVAKQFMQVCLRDGSANAAERWRKSTEDERNPVFPAPS